MSTQHGAMGTGLDPAVELKRIFAIGVLDMLLLICSVLLEGPVSILTWMLLGAALLCTLYIILATRTLMKHHRSHDVKNEAHE